MSATNLFSSDPEIGHAETRRSSFETSGSSQTNLSALSTPETNPETPETTFQFASTSTMTGQHSTPKIPNITILPCNLEDRTNQESENVNLEPRQVPTLLGETFSSVSSVEGSSSRSGRTRVSSLSSVTFSQNYSTFHYENESQNEGSQHFRSLEMESEIHSRKKDAEKTEAQILAAKRSMLTNFILGSIFFLFVISVLSISPMWRPACFAFLFLFMRIALPIFTTIANFGTVQFVLKQYWNGIQNNSHCCSNE